VDNFNGLIYQQYQQDIYTIIFIIIKIKLNIIAVGKIDNMNPNGISSHKIFQRYGKNELDL
jgi:hypothetical protein